MSSSIVNKKHAVRRLAIGDRNGRSGSAGLTGTRCGPSRDFHKRAAANRQRVAAAIRTHDDGERNTGRVIRRCVFALHRQPGGRLCEPEESRWALASRPCLVPASVCFCGLMDPFAQAEAGQSPRIDPQSKHADKKVGSGETDQRTDQNRSHSGSDGQVRRVSSDGSPPTELPWPPVPSRVLPGQSRTTNRVEAREPVLSLLPPPAPRKTLPRSSSEEPPDPSAPPVESEPAEQN